MNRSVTIPIRMDANGIWLLRLMIDDVPLEAAIDTGSAELVANARLCRRDTSDHGQEERVSFATQTHTVRWCRCECRIDAFSGSSAVVIRSGLMVGIAHTTCGATSYNVFGLAPSKNRDRCLLRGLGVRDFAIHMGGARGGSGGSLVLNPGPPSPSALAVPLRGCYFFVASLYKNEECLAQDVACRVDTGSNLTYVPRGVLGEDPCTLQVVCSEADCCLILPGDRAMLAENERPGDLSITIGSLSLYNLDLHFITSTQFIHLCARDASC